jgi:hypothetical protein
MPIGQFERDELADPDDPADDQWAMVDSMTAENVRSPYFNPHGASEWTFTDYFMHPHPFEGFDQWALVTQHRKRSGVLWEESIICYRDLSDFDPSTLLAWEPKQLVAEQNTTLTDWDVKERGVTPAIQDNGYWEDRYWADAFNVRNKLTGNSKFLYVITDQSGKVATSSWVDSVMKIYEYNIETDTLSVAQTYSVTGDEAQRTNMPHIWYFNTLVEDSAGEWCGYLRTSRFSMSGTAVVDTDDTIVELYTAPVEDILDSEGNVETPGGMANATLKVSFNLNAYIKAAWPGFNEVGHTPYPGGFDFKVWRIKGNLYGFLCTDWFYGFDTPTTCNTLAKYADWPRILYGHINTETGAVKIHAVPATRPAGSLHNCCAEDEWVVFFEVDLAYNYADPDPPTEAFRYRGAYVNVKKGRHKWLHDAKWRIDSDTEYDGFEPSQIAANARDPIDGLDGNAGAEPLSRGT